MFGLQNQQQIQHPGFQRSEILLHHVQEVLGQRQVLVRVTDVQRTSLGTVPVDVVGVGNDGREL